MITANTPQSVAPQTIKTLPILRKGSVGDAVRILQQLLKFRGLSLEIDGQFRSRTEQAVKVFQGSYRLTEDGIVGKDTWHYLSFEIEYGGC